jgi:hypothetical protein
LAKKLHDHDYLEMNPMHGETIHRMPNPTLNELLEACGDRFDALIKDSEVKGDWVATANNGDADNLVSATSSTPEEAVALLWIEINKKRDEK